LNGRQISHPIVPYKLAIETEKNFLGAVILEIAVITSIILKIKQPTDLLVNPHPLATVRLFRTVMPGMSI
jgi:hypothetical protein